MRDAKPLPEITADWLLARVVECDGCLLWQLECANNGQDPRASINGEKFYVRRAIWAAMHGRQPRANELVGTTCSHPLCCEPAHVVARSRSQALKGIPKTLAHKAAIARTKRHASDLSQEVVHEIKSSDLSGPKEAALRGISKDMVNRIRAGLVRRDYSSPFAGLGV